MRKRPDNGLWPARRAGHTRFSRPPLSPLATVLAAILGAMLAAGTAVTVLPAAAAAWEVDGPEQPAPGEAEVGITRGCVSITGDDETITVGPDCKEVTGEQEKTSEQPTGEPGPEGELQENDSARQALDGLVRQCETNREPERFGSTGARRAESTTEESTTDMGQPYQAGLSEQECDALLDAFAFEKAGDSPGNDTGAKGTTSSQAKSPKEPASEYPVPETTVPETTTGESGETGAATSTDARPADDFVDSIGVNTHVNYTDTAYGDFELVKSKLEDLGIRHIRDKAHLGEEDFNERIYGRYRDLKDSADIETNLIVDPREEGLSTVDAGKVDQINELSGDSLGTLEGPNELDIAGAGDWPEKMRTYQQDLFTAVNDSSAPDTPVLSASLAHAKKAGEVGEMVDVIDAGSMHPYPGGGPPTNDLEDYNIDNTRQVSGEKPLAATETGYHTAEDGDGGQAGVSEAAQAKYLPRLFLEYFDRGIARTFSYELLDQRPDPTNSDQEENFGLVRADGTEKPAFTALANLISLLEEPERESEATPATSNLDYSLSGDMEEVRQVFLQKQDGTFFLVLWQEVPSYDTEAQQDIEVSAKDVTVSFGQDVGEVATYLPSESAAPAKRYAAGENRQLELAVPDHPLIVEVAPVSGSSGSGEEPEPTGETSTGETVPTGTTTSEHASSSEDAPSGNTPSDNTSGDAPSSQPPPEAGSTTRESQTAGFAEEESPEILQGVVRPGAPKDPSAIDAHNRTVGADADVVTWFEKFGEYGIEKSKIENVQSRGATPHITLEPEGVSLESIAGGGSDDWIDDFAATLAEASPDDPVLVRFAHEMNGGWFPWGEQPEDYKAAFRRVSKRIEETAPNAEMVFCPNVDFPIEDYYPGNEYVDWLGLDGYNQNGDQSPEDLFADSYEELTALDADKPVMIGETASTEYPGKGEWIRDLYTQAIPEEMPRIRLVVYFDVDKERDWRIDSSHEALDAYRDVARQGSGEDTGSEEPTPQQTTSEETTSKENPEKPRGFVVEQEKE